MKTVIPLGLFVTGCGSAPTTMPPDPVPPQPQPGMASVRVVHASPDAPAVDVWAKGVDAVATGFLAGQPAP